jgi:hypothetical protein
MTPVGTFNYENFVDTYANLLYKLGNKEEAIKWEKTALEYAEKNKNAKLTTAIATSIAKMEKNESTWE